MRLDEDCVRDILLVTEKYSSFAYPVNKETYLKELENKYTEQKILYHIRQCAWSKLLIGYKELDAGIEVSDLSPGGHNFLSDTRRDTNWNRTKEIARNAGSTSIGTLRDIASQVIAELISNQFK